MCEAVTTPDGLHAFWLTMLMVAIAVPLNTVFGVVCALVLVRQRVPGQGAAQRAHRPAVRDLAGRRSASALILVYGRDGWFGGWLAEHGIQVIFSMPGMVLATIFVSLPFVVREVVPVLQEIGTEQEQAASTLGRRALADLLAHHPAGDPLGRRLRRRPDDRARARRVRRGRASSRGKIAGRDRDADAATSRSGSSSFDLAGAYAASLVLALHGALVIAARR